MSEFRAAMLSTEAATNNLAFTQNGAISYASSLDAVVDLFFKSCRGTSPEEMRKLVTAAYTQDKLLTMKCIAYIRDCRGGKGERELARVCYTILQDLDAESLKLNLKPLLGVYGRWDDGVHLGGEILVETTKIMADQLREDLTSEHPSLCAKWMPSESSDSCIVKKVARAMGLTGKVFERFRKEILSPIRSKLHLLETQMCAKKWNEIKYPKVPSVAMKIHGKAPKMGRRRHGGEDSAPPPHMGAFRRNDPERFAEYLENLRKGKTTVNAKMLFPHQVVEHYDNCGQLDELIEAQWRVMVDKLQALGSFDDFLVLSDVSGSMSTAVHKVTPMLVSCTMGLLVSQVCKNPAFKDLVLTFESQPKFADISGESLYERYRKIHNMPWGGSTNVCGAFKTMLDRAMSQKVAPENMPKKLLIVSDMQFNQADGGNCKTNYDTIKLMYEQSGYELPHIVFWNVNGDLCKDVPATADTVNVSLISGFSTDILKCVLKGTTPTPTSTMLDALNDERYDLVHVV